MTPNPHLATAPIRYGSSPKEADIVVYAVHGRGQSPEFMKSVARCADVAGSCWVMPEAHGHAWYPQGFLEPVDANQPLLDQALDAVSHHLSAFGREVPPHTPVVLFGFSQGACLLAEHLLREQPACAGAILHTGGYIGPNEHDWPRRGNALTGLPVLMATAVEDAWVPLHRVEATARALSDFGATVELHEYDDQEHHINDDSVTRVRDFLRRRMMA